MKNSTRYTMSKWFCLGFGIRTILALIVLLMVFASGFEASLVYLADLPTMMFLDLIEVGLPQSVFMALVSGHPFYLPMNLIAGLLWGGIFMLCPLVVKMVLRLWH